MLVRPFIQPISAFDVTNSNGIAYICVLGGDEITNINYEIFQNDMQIYSGSMVVTDNGGSAIRTFQVALTQAMGLVNNSSYTIRAWTSNTTENSGYSSAQLFVCYVTPSITLVDNNNVTIGAGYEFTTQSGTLNVVFDKVDNSSPALLDTFSMDILGVDSRGNLNLVYSSGEICTPFVVPFDNILPTTASNPLYESYVLKWVARTTQNTGLKGSLSALFCDYAISEHANLISVENQAENGRIKISFQASNKFSDLMQIPYSVSSRSTYAMAIDSENVYCAGAYGEFAIYNKATKSFGEAVANPFGYVGIFAMVADSENVYCGGESSAGSFAIYNKVTQTFGEFVSSPFGNNYIFAMGGDSENIYCGGVNGKFAIYNKSTHSFGDLITTPFDSTYFESIVVDDNNVYCGGRNGKFAIYNKATQSFGALVPNPFTGNIDSLATDSNNVYCGDSSGNFAIYNKVTQSFGSLIANPFSEHSIESIAISNDKVYCSGGGIGSSGLFAIYNKTTGTFGELITNPFENIPSNVRCVADGLNVYCVNNDTFSIYGYGDVMIRRKENNEYVTLVSIKDFVGGFFYDYYTKPNTIYEYQITTNDKVETVQVLSQFCKSYIADGDKAFELYEEWNIGSYQRNQKSVIYEPYGSKYPFVAYNAVTNYDNGSDTALYRAPSNIGKQYLDSVAEAQYNKELLNFLTNRKVKVRKTYNGEIALVAVLDAVPNNYNSEMGNTLASTTFKWVEVGDFTDDDFKKLGITNSFMLYGN